MMLLTIAALLQAAQPAPATSSAVPQPAWRTAGHAWGQCVKGGIDARLMTGAAPEALVDAAIAGCATRLETVRRAIAAERGRAVAAGDVEQVRSGGRATFLNYVVQSRSRLRAAPGR